MFNASYNTLIEKMTKDKRTEIVNKLKSTPRTPINFKIQKLNNNYVIVLNIPFLVSVINIGNFAQIFKFGQTILEKNNIILKTDYVSENILEFLKPLSVIEWHCNIT